MFLARCGVERFADDRLHADRRGHLLRGRELAELARFLLVVEHDGVSTQCMARTISESVCCWAILSRSRVCFARFPGAAFAERVFQDRVEVRRQRAGVGDRGEVRGLLPGRHANAIAFALVAGKAGLRDCRFDARQLAVRQRLAAEQVRVGPAVPCRNK